MANSTCRSRLDPSYLVRRHAGSFFFFLALGFLAGTAFRDLFQPVRHRGEAEIRMAPESSGGNGGLDWSAKLAEWRALTENSGDLGLLNNNLRWAAKSALAGESGGSEAELTGLLSEFAPRREFSANLMPPWMPNRLQAGVSASLIDVVVNLDFQSLAVIASDMSGPRDGGSWKMPPNPHPASDRDIFSNLLTDPEHKEAPFRIFFAVHTGIHGEEGDVKPLEAWRTVVDEVTERLELEAKFPGGGGFGKRARAELAREISVLPLLIANGLFNRFGKGGYEEAFRRDYPAWRRNWNLNSSLELRHVGVVPGHMAAALEYELRPLSEPRNVKSTRLAPLAAAIWLSHIAAREARMAYVPDAPPKSEAMASAEPKDLPEVVVPHLSAAAAADVSDADETSRLREKIMGLEHKLRQARIVRDAARLRLETARNREGRLASEHRMARERADRLWESREDARLKNASRRGELPEGAAELLRERDAVSMRLNRLLENCTEEHPFVKQARKELAAIEAGLSGRGGASMADRGREAENNRMSGLEAEWKNAMIAADGLRDRRLQLVEEAENALAALPPAEENLSDCEIRLETARNELLTFQAAPRRLVPAPVIVSKDVVSEEAAASADPVGSGERTQRRGVVFSGLPIVVYSGEKAPGREAMALGAFFGLVAGLLWAAARELTAHRFYNPREAGHMVDLPLLVALPVYKASSMRQAARMSKGILRTARSGCLTFVPAPLDAMEPPPLGKRGGVVPARRFPRLAAWLAGLLTLALAAMLHSLAAADFTDLVGFHPEPASLAEFAERLGGGGRETGNGRID